MEWCLRHRDRVKGKYSTFSKCPSSKTAQTGFVLNETVASIQRIEIFTSYDENVSTLYFLPVSRHLSNWKIGFSHGLLYLMCPGMRLREAGRLTTSLTHTSKPPCHSRPHTNTPSVINRNNLGENISCSRLI
jgi:hypothetical protein